MNDSNEAVATRSDHIVELEELTNVTESLIALCNEILADEDND